MHIIYSHSYCSENLDYGRNQPKFGRSKYIDLCQAEVNFECSNFSILSDIDGASHILINCYLDISTVGL
jgi:hypothetical protein